MTSAPLSTSTPSFSTTYSPKPSSSSTRRPVSKSAPEQKKKRSLEKTSASQNLPRQISVKTGLKSEVKSLLEKETDLVLSRLQDLLYRYMQQAPLEVETFVKEQLQEYISNENSDDVWFRTSDLGVHVWTAYMSLALVEIFDTPELKTFLSDVQQQNVIVFWEMLIDLLKRHPEQLKRIADVNTYACELLQEKTDRAAKTILHALTLQCVTPQIFKIGADAHRFSKSLLGSFKNDELFPLLEGFEKLCISGETNLKTYSLRQAIASYDASTQAARDIYTLLNSYSSKTLSDQIEAAWPAFNALDSDVATHLFQSLIKCAQKQYVQKDDEKETSLDLLSNESPVALIWKLYIDKTLSSLLSTKRIGKLAESLFDEQVDTQTALFWDAIATTLQKKSVSLITIKKFHQVLDIKTGILRPLFFSHFVPQIISYANSIYPLDAKTQGKFFSFISQLKDSLDRQEETLTKKFQAIDKALTI